MVVAYGYGIETILDHFFAVCVFHLDHSIFIIISPLPELHLYVHPVHNLYIDIITVITR